MTEKQRLLIKISGEVFSHPAHHSDYKVKLLSISDQIAQLHEKFKLGIVIGGGNLFRAKNEGVDLGFKPAAAHEIGMLATLLNGRIMQELLEQRGVPNVLMSAFLCPAIAEQVKQKSIDQALEKDRVIIFAGGTGNPFFTTDTNAVLRALQIGATEVWKASKVTGVYNKDPHKDSSAQLLKQISHNDAIAMRLGIMDLSSLVIAQQHDIKIRIFNLFEENAFIKALKDSNHGSVIG